MFRADDLLAGRWFVFINHFAGVIGDLEDGHGRHAFAAVGEHGISAESSPAG